MIRTALDQCTDSKLYVAMNPSLFCLLYCVWTKLLGLTWSNVHISDKEIAADNAYVYIDKELTRASKRAIEMLGQKDISPCIHALISQHQHQSHLEKAKDRFQYPQGMATQDLGIHFARMGKHLRMNFGDFSVTNIRTTI